METLNFFTAVRRKMSIIVLFGLLCGALSFLFLNLSQEAFKVRTDFFITQNNPNSQDFYAMSRSNEYIGKILSEAIYSERFIDAAIETGKINGSSLPVNKKEKLDQWSKSVSITKNLELGMISVTVFNKSQIEAVNISQAIAQVLIERNSLFRGGDEKSVDIRIFSGPIVESNPSTMQFVAVSVGGLLFGVLFALMYVFAKTEIMPSSKKSQVTFFHMSTQE